MDLDLARGEGRIARGLGAQLHRAGDEHDRFGARLGGPRHHLGRASRRIAGELDEPGAVAKVDEHQAAKVAPPVDPAAETHLLTHARASAHRNDGCGARWRSCGCTG